MKNRILRISVAFTLILLSQFASSQYKAGVNYFKIGGVSFNKEKSEMSDFLPLVVYNDSTQTDSTVYKGNNEVDLTFGYHVAISKFIVLGVNSRFLQSEESSYRIQSFGGSVRFAFPLKFSDKPKFSFLFDEENVPARNLFFIDYTGLFGNLFYDQFKSDYKSHNIQFGMNLRIPTPQAKFIRHLGIEIAGGVNFRTAPYGTSVTTPVATGGIVYYFDRNYTNLVQRKQ